MHVDQRGAWAAVAHPVHHLPQRGAGGSREVIACVPQVKCSSASSASASACSQTRRRKLLCRRGIPVGLVKTRASGSGATKSARCLWWPVEVAATWQLGKGSFYADCARSQVDVTAPQRRQLAPSETAENSDPAGSSHAIGSADH
jgi:hypothetical protein